MTVKLQDLESELRDSPNEWRWHAASVIQDIPPGYTYRPISASAGATAVTAKLNTIYSKESSKLDPVGVTAGSYLKVIHDR